VQFEISHEIDAPLDALELALMSPDLGPLVGHAMESLESVQTLTHEVDDDGFHRVWRFQARAPINVLRGYEITRDMMSWDEEWTYRHRDHSARFNVIPRPGVDMDAAWRQRFESHGTYRLDPLADGRTRRTVSGTMRIDLKLIGKVVERFAVAELKKAYEVEAGVLLSLCSVP
jgi:hypothetical protein